MSNYSKISQLPAAGPLVGSELVPMVQQGQTVAASVASISGLSVGYSFQTPATGFTIQVLAGVKELILDSGADIASGTIVFPTAASDGQEFGFKSVWKITALTCNGGTNSVEGAPTAIGAGGFATFIYVASKTTWYRVA